MMKKRLIAGFAALLICLCPAWCSAREETESGVFSSGEWEYGLNEDGTVTITHWRGNEGSVVIPGQLDGLKVTEIGEAAFSTCSGLKDVTIPDSVTKIGSSAFTQCSGIAGITIPDSVTEIGDYAFCLCGGLKDVTIPDSVTRIGKMSFTACALSKVSIPASVTEIGRWAFGSCHSLTDIEVSPENEYFTVMNNALVETKTKTLIGYPEGLTDPVYVIPEGIRKIGDSAFSYCDNLEDVTVPDGVEAIGEHAFSSCRGLTGIRIPESVQSIGICAFLNCKRLTDITIPEGAAQIGRDAFDDCDELTLTVTKDSFAEQYAKENGIPYQLSLKKPADINGYNS